ncbi:hypothetical protein BN871_DJ_00040 [Paenibacillus sp. P22]|nr:hypothetical protein BN871_DJ_00040 [Paenibacillus sp. P22]
MAVGRRSDDTPSRSPLQEADLHEIRLVHILDRLAFLADRRCDRVQAYGAAAIVGDHRLQHLVVDPVESERIHRDQRQRLLGELVRNDAVAADLREIANPLEEPVGDPRRSPRAQCDLGGRIADHADLQNLGGAGDDERQLVRAVILQPADDSEAVAQRGAEQPGAGRGSDQRERGQVKPHGARAGTFADHDVQAEILHRRVQHFLHGAVQAVDFVDEQHIALLQVREQGGQISRTLDRRAGGRAQVDAELVGDDVRESRFAESRRAVEQHMVESLLAELGRLDEYLEVVLHLGLADVLGEIPRTQAVFDSLVLHHQIGGNDAIVFHAKPPFPLSLEQLLQRPLHERVHGLSGLLRAAHARPGAVQLRRRITEGSEGFPRLAPAVLAGGGDCRSAGGFGFPYELDGSRRDLQLVLEVQNHPLGRLLADAGQPGEEAQILAVDGRDDRLRAAAGQNSDRDPRPDAGYLQQLAEERLLLPRLEAEQLRRVLAHMVVAVDGYRLLPPGERVRIRRVDLVPDIPNVDDDIIRIHIGHTAFYKIDHLRRTSFILDIMPEAWAWQTATASASATSSGLGTLASLRNIRTISCTWRFSALP